MKYLIFLLVVAVGAVLPLQALVNARLGQATAGAVFAATVSFLVGTISLVLLLVAMRPAWPSVDQLARLPAWAWTGGLIGAAYVAIATLTVPRLGASALISLTVLGQLTGAVLLDHFGVLHAPQPASPMRIAGVLLILGGVLLVVQPWKH
ncbi:DMT family transporter [Lysobacter sp. F60174L2]|uniref:DMT family transporter n=1 Tax=Lysobacter sp. F60174L2 TaxID=3459295 RepID=UPI00403D86AF